MTLQILLCDDDAATRWVLKRFLSRHYRCDIAECDHGQAALEHLKKTRTDLLILDLNMPIMDGLTTLEAIRANPATAGLTVMILTEDRSEPVVRRALGLGVSAFAGKPLNASRLRDKFDELILTMQARGA